jgi:hypothetical protein
VLPSLLVAAYQKQPEMRVSKHSELLFDSALAHQSFLVQCQFNQNIPRYFPTYYSFLSISHHEIFTSAVEGPAEGQLIQEFSGFKRYIAEGSVQ